MAIVGIMANISKSYLSTSFIDFIVLSKYSFKKQMKKPESDPIRRNIINKNNLAQLPTGSVLVNCARGAHVVDEDLIEALDTGQIASAVLDVFQAEPLPQDHPFWSHPKITITPHMASLTVAHSAAHYVVENIRRVERGELPLNLVDFSRGY